MRVGKIIYTSLFIKEFKKIPLKMLELALKKETIFRNNPLHPSLRLHALHGKLDNLWSISISRGYRIIFERQENGDVLFLSIGKHDIYKCL